MPVDETPGAVTAKCPACGEETLQTVLRGRQSRGGLTITLDATVQCTECQHTHHIVQREAAPMDVPVVISRGNESRRTLVSLTADDEIELEEALIVDGMNCKITGLEDKEGRRVDAALVKDLKTIWTKEFEDLAVKWAINLRQKTITKVVAAKPTDTFTVGEERVFGRLRVTVHAIKTEERLIKRGSADAAEIVRVFAAPTPLGDFTHRPDKRSREALREQEEHRRR